MQQLDWQQRFEAWLAGHLTQGDSAHDISHFRRVWGTAQRLAEESQADRLVILTACYFHDIVSLPKNHPERSRSSVMAAEKRWLFSSRHSLIFRTTAIQPFIMRLKRTVSVPVFPHKARRRKLSRTPIGWRRLAQLVWPASSRSPGR